MWPLLLFLPMLLIVMWLAIAWAVAQFLGWDAGFVLSVNLWVLVVFVSTVVLAVVVNLTALVSGSIRYLCCLRSLRRESLTSPGWIAGTTGCIDDGAHIRNGKEPLPTSVPGVGQQSPECSTVPQANFPQA